MRDSKPGEKPCGETACPLKRVSSKLLCGNFYVKVIWNLHSALSVISNNMVATCSFVVCTHGICQHILEPQAQVQISSTICLLLLLLLRVFSVGETCW